MEESKDVNEKKSSVIRIGRIEIDCGSEALRNEVLKELGLLEKYAKQKKRKIELLLENKVDVKISMTVNSTV